jgi:hypothetical protein
MMPTATIAEASKLFMLLSVELTIWLRCHQKPLLIVKGGFRFAQPGSCGGPWQSNSRDALLCMLLVSLCAGGSTKGLPMTEEKAREIAHGLIQGYIGPDHKVIDMRAFFSALVQALRDASTR